MKCVLILFSIPHSFQDLKVYTNRNKYIHVCIARSVGTYVVFLEVINPSIVGYRVRVLKYYKKNKCVVCTYVKELKNFFPRYLGNALTFVCITTPMLWLQRVAGLLK
jgi:hypothetical protein